MRTDSRQAVDALAGRRDLVEIDGKMRHSAGWLVASGEWRVAGGCSSSRYLTIFIKTRFASFTRCEREKINITK